MPLIIKKSDFVKSATNPSHFPDDIYSEFCFAGKSNVGKSSMLNKICNRKKLAITSKTPGRTQLINFFIINNNMSFVDIPGYGFANVPKNIILSWEKMIINYLENRKNISAMFIAVDIRRGIEKLDKTMITLCQNYNIKTNIIITKSDKVSKSERSIMKQKVKKELQEFNNVANIETFSSKNGDGVSEVLEIIGDLKN